ncbi:MAG: NAD(P)-dependent oxidoreductase [Clostridia bacterium]|nr:NAD(P)-dependent oxidoreductase [Clostridia bacterium]
MKLGFIGYGEAAKAISGGLKEEGLKEQYAWDIRWQVSEQEELAATRVESMEELFGNCDVVMCLTPASASIAVAEQCKEYMTKDHIYVDASSSSPKVMETVWDIIKETGVQFADGALLDTVPKYRHKTPLVLAGNGAQAAYDALVPYGMKAEVVGTEPGSACAIKMLRSVYTKAHLACAFEMLEAAVHYGVEDYIMASLAKTMDEKDFISGMSGRTCGGVIHAARRSEELAMAAEMMEESGLSAGVAKAGSEKLREIGELNLKEKLGAYRPKTWKEAMHCVKQAKEEKK